VDPLTATANNLLSFLAIVLFTALYSMSGGLRGVVATDLVQFALAVAGTVGFAWILVAELGGPGEMTARLVELYGEAEATRMLSFAPGWGGLLLPFLTIVSLQWVFQFSSDGTGYLAQRSMACADRREATIAGITFAWLQILFRSLPWLLIAVALLVVFPYSPEAAGEPGFAATRELAFVHGIEAHMPPGLRGLLLTGLLAALASTLDTHMNWGASYWSNDLYRRLLCETWLGRRPAERELVLVARLSTVVILLIAFAIMLNLDSVQEAWHLSLLFGAGVGSVLVMRWLWERINLWSEVAAMVTSLVVAPVVLLGVAAATRRGWLGEAPGLAGEAVGLAAMAVTSTVAAVAVTWWTPPTDPRQLQAFYRRVRPPGWWGRTAARAGEDPREPRRRLAGVVLLAGLTAASLFLCLYGSARLLLPLPDGSRVAPTLALLLGLALVPQWWRRLAG
jgi:solute:Na+ symporter, SSS family